VPVVEKELGVKGVWLSGLRPEGPIAVVGFLGRRSGPGRWTIFLYFLTFTGVLFCYVIKVKIPRDGSKGGYSNPIGNYMSRGGYQL